MFVLIMLSRPSRQLRLVIFLYVPTSFLITDIDLSSIVVSIPAICCCCLLFFCLVYNTGKLWFSVYGNGKIQEA